MMANEEEGLAEGEKGWLLLIMSARFDQLNTFFSCEKLLLFLKQ